jgi:hypothetical protein
MLKEKHILRVFENIVMIILGSKWKEVVGG